MKLFNHSCRLMGSDFQFTVITDSTEEAQELFQVGIDEVSRLEQLLSEFLPTSETSRINQNAGKQPIKISRECFQLLERSIKISRLTEGCFDVSIGALKTLYRFNNKEQSLPSNSSLAQALEHVGYQHIQLNPIDYTVQLKRAKMRISFAAIGKGYAADRVKALWRAKGVQGGYISAGGDISLLGAKPDGSPWMVGITDPDNSRQSLLHIPVYDLAVATSGDYEQFFVHQGKRYSHNIDPRTGRPLTGLRSVTILSPSAELSDSLATAVYTMGSKKGRALIDQLPNTHAILVDEHNQILFSKKIHHEMADA